MIKRYKFGNFVNTEACVKNINISEYDNSFFKVLNNTLVFDLENDDVIYGLGEQVRGLNKRGWTYTSWCSDETDHFEDRHSLYGAHNFIMICGKNNIGLFFDTPEKVVFDIGFTDIDKLLIKMDDLNVDVYVITAESKLDIVKEFRSLIGKSYLAPLFAFGYQQSRWSYMTKEEVLDIIKKYKEVNIPLECVYLDIDYMERFKDFTLNNNTFNNIKEFNNELKKENIHLIPIIDAGVKLEKDYFLYEEGKEKGYFVKDENGNDFLAAVWPGIVCFPDFLRSDVRKWFGEKYKILTDLGFDGFWNDMNEPAMFYVPDRLKNAITEISKLKDKEILDMDLSVSDVVKGNAFSLQNNYEDYKKMYHLIDDKLISHEKLHNIYGYNMTRSAYEGLDEIREDRTLLFSRASYIGAHRYGGIWTGDNKSIWSHIELIMKQMSALNMSGFIYTGSDFGGFGSDASEDLLIRWLEFSIFTPLLRNHACSGTRRQELYLYKNITTFKNLINLRYSFIPYLYSEYLKAIYDNDMMFKPLSFVYENDEVCKSIEDQYIIGDSIMICPMYQQNQNHRYVYLPENMKMIKFRSYDDYDEKVYEKGHHYIECKLNEVIIFIRPNHMFITTDYKNSVEELNLKELKIFEYTITNSSYEYYLDDGISNKDTLVKYNINYDLNEISSELKVVKK